MRTCRTCQEPKPLGEFYSKGAGRGHFVDCKPCVLKARQQQYSIDPQMRERLKAQAASWRHENPARAKEIKRKRHLGQHGLTADDYLALLEYQGYRCAICQATDPGSRWDIFAVDHDHATGVVRGLLCHRCNVGLGHFLDDPARLRAAIGYLEQATALRGA